MHLPQCCSGFWVWNSSQIQLECTYTLEPHPENTERHYPTHQNGLGPTYHSNGHIWGKFTSFGLIWQIPITIFFSRFVWSWDLVQAKCFVLFVYPRYGFGCLAGRKRKSHNWWTLIMFISDLLWAAGGEENATTKEGLLRQGSHCIQREHKCCAIHISPPRQVSPFSLESLSEFCE